MTARCRVRVAGALALLLTLGAAAPAHGRVVTDSAGRQVEIPERVGRVFAAGPPAAVAVFVVAPDALLGWTRPLSDDEKSFLPQAAAALPVLGQLTGRAGTASLEGVIAARPDLIVDVGDVDPTYASLAERVQRQTGIPYLLLDGSLVHSGDTLRTLGDWLGRGERGRALGAEADAILAALKARLAAIPSDRRPRVYQARSASGLETSLSGSIGAQVVDLLGARTLASSSGAAGIASVSLEQVLQWDPEVILTLDAAFFERVWREPAWAGTSARANRRIHLSPALPFGWLDAPPSVNRLLGLRWAAARLYPELSSGDFRQETRDFYRRFYGVELEPSQLERLLGPGDAPR